MSDRDPHEFTGSGETSNFGGPDHGGSNYGGSNYSGPNYGGGPGMGRGPGTGGGSRLLDDLARLMTDAAGVAQGARREVETVMRGQAERFISQMDLVSREEFEAVRDMAANARRENEALRADLEALKSSMKPATKTKSAE